MSIHELEQNIKEAIKRTSSPLIIYVGYGKYADLMEFREFSDNVIGSSIDPRKRTYKAMKIKITQDKNQLEVKTKDEHKKSLAI